jgi:hypothetical protein
MCLTNTRYGGAEPSIVEDRPSSCRSSSSLANNAVATGDGASPCGQGGTHGATLCQVVLTGRATHVP